MIGDPTHRRKANAHENAYLRARACAYRNAADHRLLTSAPGC